MKKTKVEHQPAAIFVITALTISILIFTIPFAVLSPTIDADSTLRVSSELDFNAGKFNNCLVLPGGNVQLGARSEIISDHFFNVNKIDYIENLTLDTRYGEVKFVYTPVREQINRTYGGTTAETGRTALETKDGGYLIGGATWSFGAGENDAWLLKIDSSGNILWNKTYGGIDKDDFRSILETSDGGYVASGASRSFSSGVVDFWILKTDSSGVELWNNTFGGSKNDTPSSHIQTSDGGFIIAGGTESFGFNGYLDGWVVKVNSQGVEEWNRTYGRYKAQVIYSIASTSDGGFIFTGGNYEPYPNMGDVWVVKIDSNGTEQWNRTFVGYAIDEGCSVIETVDSSGYLIAGYRDYYSDYSGANVWLIKIDYTGFELWNKTYSIDVHNFCSKIEHAAEGGYILICSSGPDQLDNNLWLLKIDDNGTEEWNKTFTGNKFDYAWGGGQASDGGYFIVGNTRSYGSGGADIWFIKTSASVVNSTSGMLYSKDLLDDDRVVSIDSFDYRTEIPKNSAIHVQFSQDNQSWYDSTGKSNGWDNLTDGSNALDLQNLSWEGPKFYYKMIFKTYDKISSPKLIYIKLFYTLYEPLGTFESKAYFTGGNTSWKTLSWEATEPIGTGIRFQLRTAETKSGLAIRSYTGSDGTSSNYYTFSGSDIWSGQATNPWVQYKVYLNNIDNYTTPILHNVTLTYNHWPELPKALEPENEFISNNNIPKFSWMFNDTDSLYQRSFQVQIDDDLSFENISFDSSEQNTTATFWQFSSGMNYTILPDGTWYWQVRTKDNDGDWGGYSKPNKFCIDTISPNSSITNPLNNRFYCTLETISGISIDSQGGVGIERTEITIERLDDNNFWTGTIWAENEFWLTTKKMDANNWEFNSTIINWSLGSAYRITSKAIDLASNIEQTPKSVIFKFDIEGPDSVIIYPEDDVWLNKLNYIMGTAKDNGGSGLREVSISIKQSNGSQFWNGAGWVSNEQWLLTTGTKEWSYNTSAISWCTGEQYIINSRVTDNVGIFRDSRDATTFKFDDQPPLNNSLKINNGSAITNSIYVNLTIYSEDPDSGIYQMSFSTDKQSWSDWEYFRKVKPHRLSIGDGTKTIYVRIIDLAGNIAEPVSDSIILNSTSNLNNQKPPEDKTQTSEFFFESIIITVTIIIFSLTAVVSNTEVGKYKLLSIFFVPLYNKLNPDNVMDNFTRGKILGFIEAKPGEHYNSIKYALKLKNGTLAHHTKVLSKEGLIFIKRDGLYTRFYPVSARVSELNVPPLKEIQEELIDIISHDSGITQHEIVKLLDLSQTVISYNLVQLKRNGLIHEEQDGREKKYYLEPESEEYLNNNKEYQIQNRERLQLSTSTSSGEQINGFLKENGYKNGK